MFLLASWNIEKVLTKEQLAEKAKALKSIESVNGQRAGALSTVPNIATFKFFANQKVVIDPLSMLLNLEIK